MGHPSPVMRQPSRDSSGVSESPRRQGRTPSTCSRVTPSASFQRCLTEAGAGSALVCKEQAGGHGQILLRKPLLLAQFLPFPEARAVQFTKPYMLGFLKNLLRNGRSAPDDSQTSEARTVESGPPPRNPVAPANKAQQLRKPGGVQT